MSWNVIISHGRFVDRIETFTNKADAAARRTQLEERLRRRHSPPMHHVTMSRVVSETYADAMIDGIIWGDDEP